MHLRCPHCCNKVEVLDSQSLDDVTCPSCNSQFNLLGGETVTYQAARRTIGHFELLEQVGVGHFGIVWKAKDNQLGRTVAVKLPRRGSLDADEAEFFLRDARAAAQLRHPHVVAVHEVGRDGDSVYIVSDFIEGASLKEWLTGQRLTPRESAELMITIAEAVQHAHDRKVIHRDLKPGNILMDLDGQPHVADFGLAKRDAGEITMTMSGQILGTPAYMSPEQARGKAHEADATSDVYSLGVILYELLTGELPFRGESRMLIVQILKEDPTSPRKFNARIPRDIETITLKCLEKEPGKRYQKAQELAEDLKHFLSGEPIQARPLGPVARGWRWCRRNPLVAGLSFAAAAILVVGAIVSTYFAVEASRRAKENLELANAETKARIDAETQKAEADSQRKQAEENLKQFEMQKAMAEARETMRKADNNVRASVDEYRAGEFPKAREHLKAAIAILEKLGSEFPHEAIFRSTLADTYGRLGDVFEQLKDPKSAQEQYQLRAAAYKQLVDESPDKAIYKAYLADAHNDIARLLDAAGDHAGAVKEFELAVASNPAQDGNYQLSLAIALARAGRIKEAAAQADKMVQGPTKPDDGKTLYNLACVYGVCAAATAKDEPSETASGDPAHNSATPVDGKQAQPSMVQLREEWKSRGMELLRKAADAGQLNQLSEFNHCLADADLASIRDRPDFPALLAQIGEKGLELQIKTAAEKPDELEAQRTLVLWYAELTDLAKKRGDAEKASAYEASRKKNFANIERLYFAQKANPADQSKPIEVPGAVEATDLTKIRDLLNQQAVIVGRVASINWTAAHNALNVEFDGPDETRMMMWVRAAKLSLFKQTAGDDFEKSLPGATIKILGKIEPFGAPKARPSWKDRLEIIFEDAAQFQVLSAAEPAKQEATQEQSAAEAK